MTSTWVNPALTEELESTARRRRFSWHFSTRKCRRWLLVQLVSMPVSSAQEQAQEQAYEEVNTRQARALASKESWANSYSRLLNDYETNLNLRHPK